MSIYTLHEGLFDKFKKNRYKEINYNEFSSILKNMEHIRNKIFEVMKKYAERYGDSYPDGALREYDANYWKQYARKNKTCKPAMYSYMNYVNRDTIELVMDDIYRAAKLLGFKFDKEHGKGKSEQHPNILCFVEDLEYSIHCSVIMPEKVAIKNKKDEIIMDIQESSIFASIDFI